MADWIDTFMGATDHLRSPPSFRLWTALATIAAVLERRVWTVTDVGTLCPNLYTILTGSPASGKGISIGISRGLLGALAKPDGLFLGPDNPTKASFLDSFEKSTKISANGMGIPMYSSMTVLCRELGVLISKYEKDFVADLTDLYDNLPSYSAPRRSTKSVNIEAPGLNILAGATPDAIGDIMPDTAWGQGFTSRIVFVYGATPTNYRDMFAKKGDMDLSGLKAQLVEFFEELHGEFSWEPDAQDAIRHWFNEEGMAPVPTYNKLVNYCGRRNEHAMKLSMLSAVSAGNGMTVTLADFRRAQTWLFEAEEKMPDVFRAMAQKSDVQLLQDCHYWAHTRYFKLVKSKRVALKETDVWGWLAEKVPTERIDGLIEALEKTGRFSRGLMPGTWVPNSLDPDMPIQTVEEPRPLTGTIQ